MKILIEKPPVWDKIIKAGLSPDPDRTVFTYGDTLYNPGGCVVDAALMAHEETHAKQQGDDPDAWWDKYLKDVNFRLEQEIEAYAKQYKTLHGLVGDRNKRFRLLMNIVSDLSGPTYGGVITSAEARKKILEKAGL